MITYLLYYGDVLVAATKSAALCSRWVDFGAIEGAVVSCITMTQI